MAKISGPVLMVIGFAVGVFSFFLNKKTFAFNGAYSLFLYLAAVITLYGFIKSLVWYMLRLNKDEKKEIAKHGPQQEPVVEQQQRREDTYSNLQHTDYDKERYKLITSCPKCGLSHYAYANFCQNCGQRLR